MESSEAPSLDEARETLTQLENRLQREVQDMLRVLRADLPGYFLRTVRDIFEKSEQADGMSDDAVAKLKQDTATTSQATTQTIVSQLESFSVWTWDPNHSFPNETPQDLDAHPKVARVLASAGQALGQLLETHGLAGAVKQPLGYRLPAYFVAGHFMKSLVANYWRALRDHQELSTRIQEEGQADQRRSRRERWEQA